jgi:ABC-type branched-subunit amino acid transport system substrate-binding protein
MPYDTEGNPESARAAAQGAVRDGARLILGPLFSASVRAASPVARAAGVNLVPFSNNRDVAGNGVFIIGLMPSDQIRRVIRYAASRGHLRFAALAPDSAYGRQVVESARNAAADIGGVLSHVELFAPDGSDLDAVIRRLGRYDDRRSALLSQRKTLKGDAHPNAARRLARLKGVETLGEVGFDALLVPVGGERLKQIAALLPYYDIETSRTRLLGVSSWLTPGLGREPPLVGAWFAAPRTEAGSDFERRYRELYGVAPHDLAALAYDATALAAVLARGENGGDFSDIALTSPNGFAGTAGIFRFQANGQVQRGLAVLEVEPWRFREVSPSPETFEALSN